MSTPARTKCARALLLTADNSTRSSPSRSAYLALVFGFRNLGLLVGSVTCIGGLFALQQVVWTQWALARGFTEPNSLLAALGCLTFLFPFWLRARARSK